MTPDPWQQLRQLTRARIALGRTGGSLPTRELLDFRLAHALARDAVLAPFNAADLADRLRHLHREVICLESAATTQADFLRHPDLGRRLSDSSRERLDQMASAGTRAPCDVIIIIADGLSSLAATEHAAPLLTTLLPLLEQNHSTLAPLIVAVHGRVALQDEIGERLRARLSLILLGERPGLGAPDSLGAYFTHNPHLGLTDAARNCVSNIRTEGLPPVEAAHKLSYLILQSLRRGVSGIALKDDAPALTSEQKAIH